MLVFFHGGGFGSEDGSVRRYDGEALARNGVATVTANYRLGIFGFLAHPELTGESAYGGSGNYGLLDQVAVLRWLHENVAAFGGNPERITIAGQSAGANSICALMVSPLARNLIAGAIASSGSMIFPRVTVPVSLDQAEATGLQLSRDLGAPSIAEMRSLPAQRLMERNRRLPPVLDGYFLTRRPSEVLGLGEQARVPLLVGWNSREQDYHGVLAQDARDTPTPEHWRNVLREMFPSAPGRAAEAYAASTRDEILQAAADLASDGLVGYGMWKWAELHGTSGTSIYRYFFAHGLPPRREAPSTPRSTFATHGDEIEYAFGNLNADRSLAWDAIDERISSIFRGAYVNFVKTGNPNGRGVPDWPMAIKGPGGSVFVFDETPHVEGDSKRQRYVLIDSFGITHPLYGG